MSTITGSLFEGMNWGTDKVFGQQKQVAESLAVNIDVLSLESLQDVVSIVTKARSKASSNTCSCHVELYRYSGPARCFVQT